MIDKMRILLEMAPTVLLIVYGQLIIKWRTGAMAESQLHEGERWGRLFAYISDPWIISSWAAAFLSSVAWLFVIERHPLNLAFPIYIGMIVGLVVLAGIIWFGETMTPLRMLGIVLIMLGVVLANQG